MEKLETPYSLERHVEGESRHLDAPVRRADLDREAEELRRSRAYQVDGHAAKTLAKYPQLRAVLIAARAGSQLGKHRAPGQLTLQVISGELEVVLPDQAVVLGAGQFFALEEPVPHDVLARQDSVYLLTLSWPGA